MVVTFAITVALAALSFLSFFAPAYSYQYVIPDTAGNIVERIPTLMNVATGLMYGEGAYPIERNDLVLGLLILTVASVIVCGLCLLFIVLYGKDSGFKIKRTMFLSCVGICFNVASIIYCAYLMSLFTETGKDIGLAFIFYMAASIACSATLVFLNIQINLTILARKNALRYEELIIVEESYLPYIKDEYQKELALANLKYMKGCRKPPIVTKKDLQKRKEEVLKIMLEQPHQCCDHDHEHCHED